MCIYIYTILLLYIYREFMIYIYMYIYIVYIYHTIATQGQNALLSPFPASLPWLPRTRRFADSRKMMNPDRHSPAGAVAHCPAVTPRSRRDGQRPSIGTCHAGCPRPGQRSEHDRWWRTAPSRCLVGLHADNQHDQASASGRYIICIYIYLYIYLFIM